MNPIIMDGAKLAGQIKERLAEIVETKERKPTLAIVTSGVDEASNVYVRNKVAAAKQCGIKTIVCSLREDMTTKDYAETVDRLDACSDVDGIIVQLPLPAHVDAKEVLSWIRPSKDVDGLTDDSVVARGTGVHHYLPCTPKGIMRLIDEYEIPVEGAHAVVVGRSELVGKPIAQMLLDRNATVTVCHSKTQNLKEITSTADILIVAVGSPEMIDASYIKPGAAVIDVGINRVWCRDSAGAETGKKKTVGDVNLKDALTVAGHITPVPGGVGPMTVAMLMENVVDAAYK